MNRSAEIEILLVDDDRDEWELTETVLSELHGVYRLDCRATYEEGIEAIRQNRHSVCLLDYRLGDHDGLEFIVEAQRRGASLPIIFLTGDGDGRVESRAMLSGASDYLVKGAFDAVALDRAIRHAIERSRMIEALRRNEQHLADAQTIANLGSWTRNIATGEIQWSEQLCAMTGISRGEGMTVESFLKRVHPDDAANLAGKIDRALGTGQDYESEYRYFRPDGETLWLRTRARIVRGMNGEPTELIGVVHDVTTQKTMETQFHAIFEGAIDAMIVSAPEGRVLDANPAALALFGRTRDEILRLSIEELIAPADRARIAAAWRGMSTGEKTEGTFDLLRPDGESRIVELRSTAHVQPGRHFSILRDVTERVRAEEMRSRLAALVESTTDGVFTSTLDRTIQHWNRGATEIYGYTAEEIVGEPISILVPPGLEGESLSLMKELRAGRSVRNFETVRLRKDGTIRNVSLTISPLLDESGNSIGVSTIVRDITEAKKLQARVALADRLLSVGTLAAGVAHEINNPLAYVLANLSFVADELASPEMLVGARLADFREAVQSAREGAERIRATARDLKLFARGDDDQRSPTDVNRVIESSLAMAANEIRHRARVERDLQTVAAIEASEARLGQVLLNVILNAAQAIPEGHASENSITVRTREHDGWVSIEVQDTGCGIPPEVRARIFEPFFTTKPVGIGTGLGLSICRGIVEKIGGQITVEPGASRGTIVTIRLPVGKAANEPEEPALPKSHPANRVRLLVVDDEPQIGASLRRLLSDDYDVESVTDARAMLSRILEGRIDFDVLLCDIMMPNVSGAELYAALRASSPAHAERVIFITGGAFSPESQEFVEAHRDSILEKPFDPLLLRARIDAKIARAPLQGKPGD